MSIVMLRPIVVLSLVLIALPTWSAQKTIVGEHRGGVTLTGDSVGHDKDAVKKIISIVESIQRDRADALVMIEGDMATEKNPDEYVSKSLTLAKEVELLLHDSLKSPPDVIIACRRLKPGPKQVNSIRFSVLPPSFKAENHGDKQRVRWVLVEKGESFEVTEYADPPSSGPTLTAEPLYIDPQLERRRAQQRQAAQRAVVEQARKADDMVARSKAKAAEKARKLERASRILAPLPTDFR